MKHIYYKNDFAVEITLLNASGEVIAPPEWEWHIEFTDGRRKYICSVDNGNANVVGNTIMCYLDNHKFCCGEVGYKFVQAIPDLNYLDGFQNLITPKALPIELWEQESDNDVNIQSSVVPAYVVYDAYMTAKANGYTGTEEEFYDALNHIVDINKKEADRVEAEANRVTAEQQRVENFVAMESALTTATTKANTATIAAEQSAERANTASDNADVATSNATQATTQATTAIKRANDISADLEAKREADYWRGAKGEKGEKGDKGDKGERGLQGVQGVKGDDGVSPTVKTSKTGKVTTIEITDAQGTHTATVNDGESVEVVQSTGNNTTSVMSQKAVSDALSNVYTKEESDAMLAEKQNVLTAGNGITIADDVISVDAISVDEKKFTVWSNPRIDEYVKTFTNYGYNDDGTQKTSGTTLRGWVFMVGDYGHQHFYANNCKVWMCDSIDDDNNMFNPTYIGKNNVGHDLTKNDVGKIIVILSESGWIDTFGYLYGRYIQFMDEKTRKELCEEESMFADMYAGNLLRYGVSLTSVEDSATNECGYMETVEERGKIHTMFLDSIKRPNINYELKVSKSLMSLYEGCGRLLKLVPLWDTSLVTSIRRAFAICRALEYVDLSRCNLDNVVEIKYAFIQDVKLLEAKLPQLPKVSNTECMFLDCSSLQSITLPSLPSVKSCYEMFHNCTSLQSITLPSLPSVTNCFEMFQSCTSLQTLYLDMPNCVNFTRFAFQCYALHTVEIVDVRKATDLSNSFYLCSSLQNITCVEELPKCAINFGQSSKLTLDSVTNIITHLPDLSAESSKTLTLHATTKSLLTESLIAEATNKNWIIA